MKVNLLEKFNDEIEEGILKKKIEVEKKREDLGYTSFSKYAIEKLKAKIIEANKEIDGIDGAEIEFIDREKFKADIAVNIPRLMRKFGIPRYTKEIIPKIVANLMIEVEPQSTHSFEKVEPVGIYINISFKKSLFSEFVKDVLELGKDFGKSDIFKGKKIVIDYSSPNMAKHLHTGHVRSTLIGEVLSEIYEAVGYTVHRLNFLNDWGGMGALIEAYHRLKKGNAIPKLDSENSVLDFIYQLVRRAEKTAEYHNFEKVEEEDRWELYKIVGEFTDHEDFVQKYSNFVDESKKRFRELENGEGEVFETWQMMRGWSMKEFEHFYDLLRIEHDYLIGESFYGKRAADFVKEKLKTGEVVLFTKELADIEIKKAQKEFLPAGRQAKSGTMNTLVLERQIKEINNDIGAYVIMLPSGARFVIMRADGATIYATRDLTSIKHRVDVFDPTRLVYEVGEEQSLHFKLIFEAARAMNVNKGADVDMKHVSHGFYVNAETGQKLSSREGAQNVISLIDESIKYFRKKYDSKDDFTDEEKDSNARKIAIGSIAFNEIKQDKRFPVLFYKELEKNIRAFEESGGAYIMYSIARAKSILRKSDKKIGDLKLNEIDFSLLENSEINLLKKVAGFPNIVLKAGKTDNPATLAEFLLHLANDYNGYYENFAVLEGGKLINPLRLFITDAVATVLSNGLNLCHAEVPERI